MLHHPPNITLLLILFLGPFVYFLMKEIILSQFMGYKFKWHKGLSISLVPGISFLVAIYDIHSLITLPFAKYVNGREKKVSID